MMIIDKQSELQVRKAEDKQGLNKRQNSHANNTVGSATDKKAVK